MADWYLLVKSPTSGGMQLYLMGDYQALGPNWTDHQLATARALYVIPEDYADGDLHPQGTYRCDLIDYRPTNPRDPASAATYHPAPPDPDWPPDGAE